MPKKQLKKILVTRTNYKIGDHVVRSHQWTTGSNLVKSPNAKGVILEKHTVEGCVIVMWERDGRYGHRIGHDNKYELYFDNDLLTTCLMNRIGHLLIEK